MNIEDIFSKQLTRDINGVVKAEQIDNESVYIELDEYIVTQELNRHFKRFFETYIPAIKQRNPAVANKIGVWISGFFGSGKSHFIKILAYLLENRTVTHLGQTHQAVDFFKDKINDATLFADIHSAVSMPADVILFNIDSRANSDDGENAILKVFLKVFNERVGYCADFPHIAHLERELDKRKQYTAFKAKFAELTGSEWIEQRDAYDFYRDELAESLAFASQQSIDSTRQWVMQLENNLPLDISNFCKWVKDYLDRQGEKNILFMIDEVGQFIGKNTQMMLKLQTITEDLGAICEGRAWVIVTSQSDIDVAIGQFDKRDGEDFSKIQGRFYTRLQLSSSNTSEVIQKRLLLKTEPAGLALNTVFAEQGDILRNQLIAMKFDAVIANPPYMGNKYLNPLLKEYLKKHYKGFEKDLFSAFMIRDLDFTKESGQLGFMSPFVWMFISSYEELRTHFIDNATLTSLIQLEYSGFDGATVPICTFTLAKAHIPNYTGSYIKLSDFKGHENQAPKTLEAIKNPDCGWFYNAEPDDFKKISGSPVAYWVSDKVRDAFTSDMSFEEFGTPRQGLGTGNNARFTRCWFEVCIDDIFFDAKNNKEALESKRKWFPYTKGGGFRKWFGNELDVVNWEHDGSEIKEALKGMNPNIPRSEEHYFKEGITWGLITSAEFSARYSKHGAIFDVGGSKAMPSKQNIYPALGLLNSKMSAVFLKTLNPTLNFQVGDIKRIPINLSKISSVSTIVEQTLNLAKTDWNNYETSWDFTENPLLREQYPTPPVPVIPAGMPE
ncbi:MAG: BREX system P-loop protein BrxC [Methylovulum sp.]|nr:BREX system P-loop protein BrxC [Methylovulum sp.]